MSSYLTGVGAPPVGGAANNTRCDSAPKPRALRRLVSFFSAESAISFPKLWLKFPFPKIKALAHRRLERFAPHRSKGMKAGCDTG